MRKKYRYVFFDLDDTLWDFHENAKLSLQDIYNKWELNHYFEDFETFFQFYVHRNAELWEAYGKGEITREYLMMERFLYPLSMMGINDHELARKMGDHYLKILPTKTALKPFAKELLDYLSPKYPITLISNGFREVQYKKIRSCQIENYFSFIVLSEDAKALKPDTRIFEYALELNQAKPQETIMIGDSYIADILGAKNAGIDQVYFKNNTKQSPEKFDCTYQISHLKEVLEIL